jgi:hypothetical protein
MTDATGDATGDATRDKANRAGDESTSREEAPNPPRTTTGPVTSPKFGSAGSGGAELEPGPPRD